MINNSRVLQRAMANRVESARLFCIPMEIEDSIKECCGYNYITPASMSIILSCDMFDLMSALEQHKRAIGKMLLDGNYGNANYTVHANDRIRINGWIDFLDLDCFSDSREANLVVSLLKETV